MSFQSEVLRLCLSLETLTLPCFGPNGLDALLENSDGHDLCTSSGMRTLSFLSPTHPCGLLVTRAVKSMHDITGDSSKKAILMLAGALKEVLVSCRMDGLFEVSLAFKYLSTKIEAHLIQDARKCSTGDLAMLRVECFRLLETCWNNCHSRNLMKVLKDIAGPLFFPSNLTDLSSLCKHLEYVKHNWSALTQYLTGMSAQTSTVAKGFIVERDFVYTPPNFHCLENFRFIIILSDIGAHHEREEQGCVSTTLKVSSDASLRTAVEYYPLQLRNLICKAVRSTGAKLILCGGRITSPATQILRELGTMAIEMVPEDFLYLIAESAGRTPEVSLDKVNETDVIVAVRCDILLVGHKRFVRLECQNETRNTAVSVLICGPTMGCCRELSQSLLNGVKMASVWCKSASVQQLDSHLLSLPGGGAWEISLAKSLEQLPSDSDADYIAKKALQKGLLSIALGLYKNASPGKLTQKNMADFYDAIASKKDAILWIDPTTGHIEKAEHERLPWEPLSTQLLLVDCVLNLLAQLLRTDGVVSVSRLSLIKCEDSDSDE